jgi:hypothetical protein
MERGDEKRKDSPLLSCRLTSMSSSAGHGLAFVLDKQRTHKTQQNRMNAAPIIITIMK